jgi:AbrB family looped-hinge helix DNA binding protein
MNTTIDRAGRIVVPKNVRDEARLLPGTPIQIRCRNGIVEIEPAPLSVTMRKRAGLTVASPKQPVGPLQARDVEETRRRIGRARGTD